MKMVLAGSLMEVHRSLQWLPQDILARLQWFQYAISSKLHCCVILWLFLYICTSWCQPEIITHPWRRPEILHGTTRSEATWYDATSPWLLGRSSFRIETVHTYRPEAMDDAKRLSRIMAATGFHQGSHVDKVKMQMLKFEPSENLILKIKAAINYKLNQRNASG